METTVKILALGGFILAVFCQIYIVIQAFRDKIPQGLLCSVIPFYALFWAHREETRRPKALALWGSGFGLTVIGAALLSTL